MKTAAWALPVIAVVAPAPAYAASGATPDVHVQSACKQPGNSCQAQYGFVKGYTFVVSITNPTAQTLYLYDDGAGLAPYIHTTTPVAIVFSSARILTYPPATLGPPLFPGVPYAPIAPGETLLVAVNASSEDSGDVAISGTLWVAWGFTQTPGADPTLTYTPRPGDPMPPSLGTGWLGGAFAYASTPPCDNCLPGATPTPTA